LRRDRIKLPVWILALVGLQAATVSAVIEVYAKSPQEQLLYASTTAPSIVSRLFGGPINGPAIGSIVINESFLFLAILVAFMSTLAVIRHTRQNEETGRAELIGSAVVGRHASLAAALLVVAATNTIIGLLVALVLRANDLSLAGSLGLGASLASLGITFAGVAAIAAQLSESSRGANSLAAMGVGIAFLLRGIGDSLGMLSQNGTAIVSAWPSWLSPIGWAQQIHPYTQGNWALFVPLGLLPVACIGAAFWLTTRRDIGMGILTSKPGPAAASPALLSPFGLAWRLQKGILRGWAVAIAILGITIGLVTTEFQSMINSNEQFGRIIEQLGGGGSATQALLGAMIAMTALAIGGYAVQALQRMRSEEATGHLEPVLATHVGRQGWMFSHVGCMLLGVAGLFLLTGLSVSISYILAADAAWSEIGTLTAAAFVHAPAVLAIGGLTVLTFGLWPRATIAVSWGAFIFCLIVMQLQAALDLPQWIVNVSPFVHIPIAPSQSVSPMPLVSLLAIAAALAFIGFGAFRHRDIVSS
jgi:ABC-2 type transport system permease protein